MHCMGGVDHEGRSEAGHFGEPLKAPELPKPDHIRADGRREQKQQTWTESLQRSLPDLADLDKYLKKRDPQCPDQEKSPPASDDRNQNQQKKDKSGPGSENQKKSKIKVKKVK